MKTIRTSKEFGDVIEQVADSGAAVTVHVEGQPKPPTAPAAKGAGMLKSVVASIAAALKPAVNTLHVLAQKFETASGRPILAKSDRQTLKSAAAEWREAWQEKNVTYTPAQARTDYLKKISQIAAGPAADEPQDPLGYETMLDEYRTRSAGAVDRMRKINADSLPIVRRALQNFVDAGQSWIDERLNAEKSEAAEFGVSFAPSNVLMIATRSVTTARVQLTHLTPGGQSNPLAYLQFLDLE